MSEKAEKLAEEPKPKKLDLGEKRVGMIDGAPWWTNFHVMFRGKLLNGKPLDVTKPDKMKRVYDEAIKGAALEQFMFVKFKPQEHFEVAVLETEAGQQALVQKVYFEYCESKGYSLFCGNKASSVFGGKYNYVVAKNGDEIVGVIMPCRE